MFLAGFQLTVFPERTAEWFAWTIDVPMTAVFLGAAYWSSAVLEIAGARSSGWSRARLTVWTVLVFTTLTLVVTLVHLDKFHLGPEQPTSARIITWGWIAIYAAVPVGMVAGLVLQARADVPAADVDHVRRQLPRGLRWLLAGLGGVLLVAGVAMLVAPESAADLWSWPLTPLTARAVGAWLVGLGWAAAHAWLIDDVDSVQPLGTHRGGVRRAPGGGPRAVRRRAGVAELAGSRLSRGAGLDRTGGARDPQSSGRSGASTSSVNLRWRSRASHSPRVSSRQLPWSVRKICSITPANCGSITSRLIS